MTDPCTYNFADLWESVAAAVPQRTALVCDDRRQTFAALEDRSSRVAAVLAHRAVGPGDFVGVQMRNSIEHVEVLLALYKLRAVPVNVNFRYVAEELRAVFDHIGLVGVVHDPDVAAAAEAGAAGCSAPPWTLAADALAGLVDASSPGSPVTRSNDDPYVICTGGTTGRPKAVVWRMEDAFFACLGGGDPTGALGPVAAPQDVPGRIVDGYAFLALAPLIHAAGLWPTLRWLLAGSKVVLLPRFDAEAAWDAVESEGVTSLNVVADAMALPLLDALRERPRELGSLRAVGTSGAPMSPSMKERLAATLPGVILRDIFGSSETGSQGWSTYDPDELGPASFHLIDTVLVDPASGIPVDPGSPGEGLVARRDRVPLRYHNDPEGSARTFMSIAGRRHALTGDLGRYEPDGRIVVIGRGSLCINSGGEKIHPEEVEGALHAHPGVRDTVVVGEPDPRWGQRVVALVEVEPGHRFDEMELEAHCRGVLAPYKVPRRFVRVPQVERTAVGKPDYRWAERVATT